MNASIVPSILSPHPGSRQSFVISSGGKTEAETCFGISENPAQHQAEEKTPGFGCYAVVSGAGVSLHKGTESLQPAAAFEGRVPPVPGQRGAPLSDLPPLCEMRVQ